MNFLFVFNISRIVLRNYEGSLSDALVNVREMQLVICMF